MVAHLGNDPTHLNPQPLSIDRHASLLCATVSVVEAVREDRWQA
jgi:hypothetical protein